MIVRGATILLVFGLVAAACGGQAFTSAGGGDPADGGAGSSTGGAGGSGNSGGTSSGGSSSTGGSSNTGGSSSTGGSGGSAMAGAGGQAGQGGSIGSDAGPGCPINLPTTMQSCQQEGLSCQYGKCCPTIAMCRGGTWQIALTDCAVPGCPATAPTQGASCTCVNTPVPCHYECATVAKSIDATCVNDVWSTVSSTCAAVPCGASMCMPGEVCVKTTSGAAFYFKCAANPCTNRALTCTCAGSLCPAGNVCGVSGTTVSCTCPNCQ